ncbi:MAG: GMC family oxidoreductase [Myxococcales bacterium]|nr:GMC family oxidoreductase [Myxococcales bacterium]
MTLRDHTHAQGEQRLDADVVVVGSGPGGASVARVLAASGRTVVVLEEGPAQPRFRPNVAHTNRYHMQEGGAMIALTRHGALPIAAGRGVGGGSLVNSAICFRTPPSVLDDWTDRLGGDDRFSAARLRPIFEEIEALIGVGETAEAIAGENNKLIVRGAQALGLPGGLLRRNAPGCVGCGLCNMGCPSGGKGSVDRNLIPMARQSSAVVQADVFVDEIEVAAGQVTGVGGSVRDPDTGQTVGRLVVKAPVVVVCCGGVGTPRLLHHAGLAERLGPAVGRGLHIHPGSALVGWCDFEVRMWTGATQGAWFEVPELPGVLPHTFSAPPAALLLLLGQVGLEAKRAMHTLHHYAGCVVMVSDRGEGTVGATPEGRASVRYRFDPQDVERMKAGMVETARVLLAGGATRVLGPVHGLGAHTSAESLQAALAQRGLDEFTLYASHPMASCRMGLERETSVVGPTGEAHALAGLYVADSSVFPTSLGVNPQLTTMAVATQVAHGIVQRGR